MYGASDRILAMRLTLMAGSDQRIRHAVSKAHRRVDGDWNHAKVQSAITKMRSLDERNTRRMKEAIARHGWPGTSRVGRTGAQYAWLLVQHADHDLDFQRRCLELLKEAVEKGDASPMHLAYLIDRVRVAEGLPQVYGTQVRNGSEPFPIENQANVDARRSEVGLPPLADQMRRMIEFHIANRE